MSNGSLKTSMAIIAAGIFLVSCTTTEQANTALATRFKGQSADSFFLNYGPPMSTYKLSNGGMLYSWSEKAKNYNTGGYMNSTVAGGQVFTTFTPGSTIEVQCSIKIQTNPKGMIVNIDVLSDSIGDWELSRCNEVFGVKKKNV